MTGVNDRQGEEGVHRKGLQTKVVGFDSVLELKVVYSGSTDYISLLYFQPDY